MKYVLTFAVLIFSKIVFGQGQFVDDKNSLGLVYGRTSLNEIVNHGIQIGFSYHGIHDYSLQYINENSQGSTIGFAYQFNIKMEEIKQYVTADFSLGILYSNLEDLQISKNNIAITRLLAGWNINLYPIRKEKWLLFFTIGSTGGFALVNHSVQDFYKSTEPKYYLNSTTERHLGVNAKFNFNEKFSLKLNLAIGSQDSQTGIKTFNIGIIKVL